ncbi:hypothetical protein HMPREF9069_00609 [Atopobium sp. oral taxon 810 str. F0209]|nr:hypothetical protein HMPREF9069_00609 [Atopobium sp. oral taxon 810 str. F0209]
MLNRPYPLHAEDIQELLPKNSTSVAWCFSRGLSRTMPLLRRKKINDSVIAFIG